MQLCRSSHPAGIIASIDDAQYMIRFFAIYMMRVFAILAIALAWVLAPRSELRSRRSMTGAIAMLHVFQELERRPEETPADWAESLQPSRKVANEHPKPRNPSLPPPPSDTGKPHLLSGPIRMERRPMFNTRRSIDECAVLNYGLRGRLVDIAFSGRISKEEKEEYDGLSARLTEIGY
jgi:hypothetical protein